MDTPMSTSCYLDKDDKGKVVDMKKYREATKPNTPSSSLTPNPSELDPPPSLPALPSTVVKGASKTPQYPHFVDVVLGNRRGASPPSARDPCRHCFYHHRVVVLQHQPPLHCLQPPPPHCAIDGIASTAPANLHFTKGKFLTAKRRGSRIEHERRSRASRKISGAPD
ncbi:hypothetical protein PIB30_097404 [Stylosanthes scabra]|uniref:Uncharacterized protein n=1 Tax=Stylosanthes scabra TaxID=79078 RepID=A0ABU6RWP0_9FABA|nr:hypothetical protein [Stylosanthes scabra]